MTQVNGWLGVEFRHFVALEAVASEASFHRAARRLGYTQSAISQQIAALERAVGHKLVERPGGGQPVRLTRAGEIVLQHARAIGARVSSAQSELQAHLAGALDPVRLGFFGRGLGALMPGIFRRLEQSGNGDLQFRLKDAPRDEELVAMVRSGEIDVSFVHLPLEAEECEHVFLLEDDYLLVAASGSDRAPASLADLAALPLIGLKPGKATCQLTDYFHSFNLEPNWVVETDHIHGIYAFVAAGAGVALLPRLATISLGPKVELVELGFGFPPRRIGLAWSSARAQSDACRAFVEAAVAEAELVQRIGAAVAS